VLFRSVSVILMNKIIIIKTICMIERTVY